MSEKPTHLPSLNTLLKIGGVIQTIDSSMAKDLAAKPQSIFSIASSSIHLKLELLSLLQTLQFYIMLPLLRNSKLQEIGSLRTQIKLFVLNQECHYNFSRKKVVLMDGKCFQQIKVIQAEQQTKLVKCGYVDLGSGIG